MGEILQLDYYYGIEAEQFSFYRIWDALRKKLLRYWQSLIL